MHSIEEFKKRLTKNGRLIGLDLGKKRIGVAICDNKRVIATPYQTIFKVNFNQFLTVLKEIINNNDIIGIVVGNPINMDGSHGAASQSAFDMVNLLSKNISIPITFWDERLSSEAAYKLSSQISIKAAKKKKKIDENAAAFILQGAIDFINN